MAAHDFTKRPEDCPRCQERRATRPREQPAKAPGTLDPDLVMDRANRAAHAAVKGLRAEEAAKQTITESWNEVIADLSRNLSPPVSTVSN